MRELRAKLRPIGMRELQAKVYNVRLTVLEMLYDRGYRVDSADLDLKFADFVARFCGGPEIGPMLHALTYSTASESDPSRKVLVLFLDGPHLLHFCNELNDKDLRLLVLVALDGSGLKTCHEPTLGKLFRFKVQIFRANDWQINPIRHNGVGGRRKIIADQEMTRMLCDNIVKDVQVIPMPRGFIFARYYGLLNGEAVKVDDDNDDEMPDYSDSMVVDPSKPPKERGQRRSNLYYWVQDIIIGNQSFERGLQRSLS